MEKFLKENWFKIALIIILLLIAYSLSSSLNPNTSIGNQKTKEEELFTKKVECQKYTKQVEDNLEQDSFAIEALHEIFYSSKNNSCLLAKYTLYTSGGERLEIDDILTKENVWSQTYQISIKYWDAEAKLDEQIKLLK